MKLTFSLLTIALLPSAIQGLSEDYELVGKGKCVDDEDRKFSHLIYDMNKSSKISDCCDKCDLFPKCLGFVWTENKPSQKIECSLQFSVNQQPWDPNDFPDSLPEGASTSSNTQDKGKCPIVSSKPINHPLHTCYKRKIQDCTDDNGVYADPLFIGFRGQIFKFNGRSDAWYANIASQQLQWNLQFGQFSGCPKDSDMFVTGTSMLFFNNDLFKRSKPAHSIVVKVASKNDFFPGCSSGEHVCLANGSLVITIDGHEITAPGDYSFANGYGRIIAHNTFGACSRKWYDYRENNVDTDNRDGNARNLRSSNKPIDYLINDQDKMLDPNQCSNWLNKRIKNDDLFDQEGDWATVHIETPLVSFHVEYRKNTNEKQCMSQSIDAWISKASPELEEQKWQGILGETARPKFDSHGQEIMFDRSKLLLAKDDEAYEVNGAFGTEFDAHDESQWQW